MNRQRSNKHMRPRKNEESHGNPVLWWGWDALEQGARLCGPTAGPAHHVHTCMKTSNWLGRKGCLGCREATRPLALQVLKQRNNVKTVIGSAPHWPGQCARKRRRISEVLRLGVMGVWQWTWGIATWKSDWQDSGAECGWRKKVKIVQIWQIQKRKVRMMEVGDGRIFPLLKLRVG